jgi:hypothetical protein
LPDLSSLLFVNKDVVALQVRMYNWRLASVQKAHSRDNVSHVVDQDVAFQRDSLVVQQVMQAAKRSVLLHRGKDTLRLVIASHTVNYHDHHWFHS